MKNVLITGATGTLGHACVSEFISKGYHVIAILSPHKKLTFETTSPTSVYNADLMNEVNTNEVIDQIIADHQSIDAALLLVGGFAMGNIEDADGSQLKKMIGLNFETAYYTGRKIFNQMKTQPNGGRLVFVGAKPAMDVKAAKSKVAYALSKTLIFKLSEILNEAGSQHGVVSTVLVPSIIDSEDNRKSMPEADPSKWVKADEIAEIVAFAISEKASTLREPVLKIYGDS